MTALPTTRREFLGFSAALGAGMLPALESLAQSGLPTRAIPSTGELLPVIGLGSSKVVSEIAENGTQPVAAVLRALVAQGGRVVDTWPRNAANDTAFGTVLNLPDLRRQLFVTSKIDQVGRAAGIAQFDARPSISSRYSA
jgi:hypothetical protein